MPFAAEQLLQELCEWAGRVVSQPENGIDSLYVFGSLIHPEGDQFLPKESDIDLLAVMHGQQSTPMSRLETVQRLVEAKIELEQILLQELGRSEASKPVASLVVASPEDLRFGIHKERVPLFFDINRFQPLSRLDATSTNLPALEPYDPGNVFMVESASRAQAERNKYLAHAADRSNTRTAIWDGTEALPKDLQRVAAHTRYAVECLDDEKHSDLTRGLEYLSQVVQSQPEAFAGVKGWLSRRRGARGESGPLSPVNALTLWEMLCEQSYKALRDAMKRESTVGTVKSTTSEASDRRTGNHAQPHAVRTIASDGSPFPPPRTPQHPNWSLIRSCASGLFLQGYPLVLVATSDEYARLAQALADETITYLLWTVNGSPLNVRGWAQNGDRLTPWDRLFRDRKCDKVRVVVFRKEKERLEYENPSSEERLARKTAFESACADRLRFTSTDLLQMHYPSLMAESRLDIGYVSTEPPHLHRLGLCFYSRFASDDFERPSRRRAQVVLFDTGRLVRPDRNDEAGVRELLQRLEAHSELIQDVRSEWNLDRWLQRTCASVPPLRDQSTTQADAIEPGGPHDLGK